MNTRRQEKEIITQTRKQNSQGLRENKAVPEMMQRAAMQTNAPDVVPPSLINGCGCLPCQAASNAAARSIHYSLQHVINEV